MTEMFVEEFMVRASIQIYMLQKKKHMAEVFGTGFIIKYKEDFFLLSVSHVTDYKDLIVTLETNLPPENGIVPLLPVGGLVHYSLITLAQDVTGQDVLDALEEGGKRLDVTFARLKERPKLMQNDIVFKDFMHIEGKSKMFIDLDSDSIGEPDKSEIYGFFGKVKPKYDDEGMLRMEPTLKNNLKYQGSDKYFHRFIAPKIINSKEDYEGCSGAPILNSSGQLVALACKIREKTQLIYGFSAKECINLLDISIKTNQI